MKGMKGGIDNEEKGEIKKEAENKKEQKES